MLRKALIGAAAAGAASLVAVGSASAAMAHPTYDVNQNDFNILSPWTCANTTDAVGGTLELLSNDNASCDQNELNVLIDKNGHDHHKHGYGYDKHGYDD